MPLLLGSRDIRVSDLTGEIDLDGMIDDFGRENYAVKLVGVREIPLRKYRRLLQFARIKAPEDQSPLEFSLLVYDDNKVQQNKITGRFYYVEVNPYELECCPFDNSQVEFRQHNGNYYGVMSPTGQLRENIPGKVYEVKKKYLLPNISEVPFYYNFISRREFSSLLSELNVIRRKMNSEEGKLEDYVTWLNALNIVRDRVERLFEDEDLSRYRKTRPSYVAPENVHPIFSLNEVFGPSIFDKDMRHPLYKLGMYLAGTDKEINNNLTGRARWKMHLTEVAAVGCGTILIGELHRIFNFPVPIPKRAIPAYIILTLIVLGVGVDSILRSYKNIKHKPNPNSGIIGSIYEKLTEQ